MRRIPLSVVFVACAFLLSLTILAFVGIRTSSDWSTFVPDLITGVVGAGAIASLIAWVQHSSDVRRARSDRVTAAYERLLEAIAELRKTDLSPSNEISALNTLGTRMIQFTEVVSTRDDELSGWLEAERQLGLFYAQQGTNSLQAAGQVSVDTHLDLIAPYLRWTAELGNNVRFWRTGKLSAAEMSEQAKKIESKLRRENAWREDALPWRQKLADP
ncbi:hypothetical protein [Herbiconiux daphne]|uniref:DUF4760 domain-containing protein n=1 Tax=Herbiconiux daphne TaxID=2970914 RepID=A0ABT2GZI0_9MICO|nr:hypothetical protein [Herbiconiux daphne]MCS5732717.1 hypothetical protein [Herbiconiux daphne]